MFSLLFAQRKTILVETDTRKLNHGNLLPAQTYFDIQVPVNEQTGIVEIEIHRGRNNNNLVEKTTWIRPVNFTGNLAEVPVDIKLKSNSSYTFDIVIYSMLSDSEKVHLNKIIQQNIINYLNATMEANTRGVEISRRNEQTISDLNLIVKKSFRDYQNLRQREFEGFSDIVKLKLQQIDNARLSNAEYNVIRNPGDSMQTANDLKANYANQLTEDLQQIILSEINNYLAMDFVKVYDNLLIKNQVTERTQTVLPLFIGYAGVYLSGNVDDLEYDSQPYAGFSIPFGRGNGAWFSRTSFVLGVFIKNFKDGDGNIITGPVIDRPVFAGLGFRVYDFIHLNAGVIATSVEKQNLSNIKTENIDLKPFIGISAQFNLWLGLNKKQ